MATRTQIYKEILREYDALRTEQAAKLRQRKEEIYRRLPRVREIDETLSMLGVQTAKLVLLKPGDMRMPWWKCGKTERIADRTTDVIGKHRFNASGYGVEICLRNLQGYRLCG